MVNLLPEFVQSIVDMPGKFGAIVETDPVAGVMLGLGGLLMLGTLGFLGYLVLGMGLDLVTPDASAQQYPRAR